MGPRVSCPGSFSVPAKSPLGQLRVGTVTWVAGPWEQWRAGWAPLPNQASSLGPHPHPISHAQGPASSCPAGPPRFLLQVVVLGLQSCKPG